MTTAKNGQSPAVVVESTPAPDDAGADTADRYEWQAMMATADVLSLYFGCLDEAGDLVPAAEFKLICEHHEDWAIVGGDDAEIVSGKHRESSIGPISTFRQWLVEGGALHLYKRWLALQKMPMCRLVTTAGLSDAGAKTARVCDRLRVDRHADDDEVLEVVTQLQSVMANLLADNGTAPSDPEPEDDVRAFLTAFRFQEAQPRRNEVPDLAGERYGSRVAERLRRPDAGVAVWRAVHALVGPRMRAAGPSVGGALPTVLGRAHDNELASRTLTLEAVDIAVRFAVTHVGGYSPLPRLIKANRMAVKMAHGGCSDNAIERADELRLQYQRYWRARKSKPSLSDHRSRVANTLQRVVDQVTEEVRDGGADWGATMWRSLDCRFRELEGTSDAYGLSADLLLGGVSDLANNCRAWFSDRFDAEAVLQQLVTEGTAS